MKPYWSMGPVKLPIVSVEAKLVAQTLDWLSGRQHVDGSWGGHGELDKLVSTCHAVMAFLAAGYPPSYRYVKEGIEWLISPNRRHDSKFWRIAPLLRISGYEEIVKQDLYDLERRVDEGGTPSPAQGMELYLPHISSIIGISDNRYLAKYLDRILAAQNKEDGSWRHKAITTAHAIVVLENYDFPNKEALITKAVSYIKNKAEHDGDTVNWAGKTADTSYMIFNILESSLKQDKEFSEMSRAAVRWLFHRRRMEGYWDSEVPTFGGESDIKSPEYFTGLAVRAIVAQKTVEDPFFPTAVQFLRFIAAETKIKEEELRAEALGKSLEKLRQRNRYFVFVMGILFVTAVALGCIFYFPWGEFSKLDRAVQIGIIGSIASIIALLPLLAIPIRYLWRKYVKDEAKQ